jgi:hypothetical protein
LTPVELQKFKEILAILKTAVEQINQQQRAFDSLVATADQRNGEQLDSDSAASGTWTGIGWSTKR